MHQQLAATLDAVMEEIRAIQRSRQGAWRYDAARPGRRSCCKTPKGWTGPKVVDGLPVEGTWRAHQVPLAEARTNPEHLRQLEAWMRSYRAEELFDGSGAAGARAGPAGAAGDRRMSANPHANGGLLLRDLALPDFRDYAVAVRAPGAPRPRPRGCSAPGCAT